MPEQRVPADAVRELYEAHAQMLLGFLLKLTHGDLQRAEDILQETLLRAWRHPEARSATGEWSRAWLITVARRIAIDWARAANSRPGEVSDERLEERPEEEDAIDHLAERAVVRSAILALPPRLREVLIETYFHDRTMTQAAKNLGIPTGTVKSRTFYALRALRDELAARGFQPPGAEPPAE